LGIRQPASQSVVSQPVIRQSFPFPGFPPSLHPFHRIEPIHPPTSLLHSCLSRSLLHPLPLHRSDHNNIALLHSGLFYFPSGLSNFAHPFPPNSLAHTLIYCLTISLVRQTSQTQSLSFFSPIFVPFIHPFSSSPLPLFSNLNPQAGRHLR
jgi:hypothetical protein